MLKIISGAQTGVDLAGLDAAKDAGFPTGGSMPKGFKDLDGFKPHYASLYGIKELSSPAYPPRTKQNVRDADATLIMATKIDSPGTQLTIKLCHTLGKPCYILDLNNQVNVDTLVNWLKNYKVVNVAGNSEKSSPGIYGKALQVLKLAFAKISETGDQ